MKLQRQLTVFPRIPLPTTTLTFNWAVSQLPVVRSEHVRTFLNSILSQEYKSDVWLLFIITMSRNRVEDWGDEESSKVVAKEVS